MDSVLKDVRYGFRMLVKSPGFTAMALVAMTLGIAESLTATFFGPSWAPAVAFSILLITLAVRPSGILGR